MATKSDSVPFWRFLQGVAVDKDQSVDLEDSGGVLRYKLGTQLPAGLLVPKQVQHGSHHPRPWLISFSLNDEATNHGELHRGKSNVAEIRRPDQSLIRDNGQSQKKRQVF